MAVPATLPEDKERQEKLVALSEALGLNHFQTEIDSLKDNMSYVRGQIDKIALVLQPVIEKLNAQTVAQQQGQQTTQNTQSLALGTSAEKIAMFADAADGLAKVVTAWRSGGQATSNQLPLVETIVSAFSKLIQIQVDNAVLNTYPQAKNYITPPDWVTSKPVKTAHEPA